jgi:hypothetical protein
MTSDVDPRQAWAAQELMVPAERTLDRIPQRQGLLRSRPPKRPKESYLRWEQPAPHASRG